MKFRTIITMCALMLGGCKTDTQAADQSASADALSAGKVTICPDGSTLKGKKSCPTTTSPPPTTTPTDTVSPNGLAGEADIADNFDVNQWLEPGEAPHARAIG